MTTIIVNGSPKGKNGNTEIFIQKFVRGMKNPCEIVYAVKQDCAEQACYIGQFDRVIIAMPLYVHAMPGILMKLFECLPAAPVPGKSMGFLVQSGFMESFQSQYLKRYLTAMTKSLNYTYLGTVIKGGAAGTAMMPEGMNKLLFSRLQLLGEYFEKYGTFQPKILKQLAKPDKLSKGRSSFLQVLSRLGLGDAMFFNMMLKQNKALSKKLDRPFTDING